MLINCLLLLPAIILFTILLPSTVSATSNTIDNITSGNETNLPNSTNPASSSAANNHTLINYTAAFRSAGNAGNAGSSASLEDFEYKNRVIP